MNRGIHYTPQDGDPDSIVTNELDCMQIQKKSSRESAYQAMKLTILSFSHLGDCQHGMAHVGLTLCIHDRSLLTDRRTPVAQRPPIITEGSTSILMDAKRGDARVQRIVHRTIPTLDLSTVKTMVNAINAYCIRAWRVRLLVLEDRWSPLEF